MNNTTPETKKKTEWKWERNRACRKKAEYSYLNTKNTKLKGFGHWKFKKQRKLYFNIKKKYMVLTESLLGDKAEVFILKVLDSCKYQ